jgi:Cu(I)/Ag(I) efflux system membrane fusion protein
MLAFGKISVEKELDIETIAIPKSAVLWAGERAVVYVKRSDNHEPVFEYREVTISGENEENYWCSNGLKVDEEIVSKGAFRVDAAAQLKNKNSLMNAPEKFNEEDVTPKLVNN